MKCNTPIQATNDPFKLEWPSALVALLKKGVD